MFATAARQKSQAITRAFARLAEAHVIEVREAEAMHREAAAADVARDLLEDVKLRGVLGRDRENADAVRIGPPNQANEARRWFGGGGHDGLRCGRRVSSSIPSDRMRRVKLGC